MTFPILKSILNETVKKPNKVFEGDGFYITEYPPLILDRNVDEAILKYCEEHNIKLPEGLDLEEGFSDFFDTPESPFVRIQTYSGGSGNERGFLYGDFERIISLARNPYPVSRAGDFGHHLDDEDFDEDDLDDQDAKDLKSLRVIRDEFYEELKKYCSKEKAKETFSYLISEAEACIVSVPLTGTKHVLLVVTDD